MFDETLQHGLTVELNQSPFLSVISDQKIRATMALMGQAKEARVSGDVAREICERTGSAAVLEGSIRSLGSQYVVALSAKNCRTSEVLDEEQAQAAKREDVLNALSQIAVRFRKKVGESLASVQSYSTPLPEATTTSLEALKAFSLGWKAHHTAGPRNAIAFYKRAIEIDPNFASAHAWLGRVYDTMGETAQSAESFRTAYGLRDRLSSLERFHLSFSYDRNLTGNLEKARDTCELWAQTYPREGLPHGFLAGAIYRAFGKYEKGVEEANKLIELDPENAFGYGNLASNLISLGRLEEAEKALDRGDARKLYLADYVVNRYQIAFLRDDQAAMDRLTAKGAEEPGAEDWISDQEATTLAYVGMMERAAVKYRKAMELAEAKGLHEAAGQHEAGVAAGEGLVGNMEAARAGAAVALGLSRGRDVLFGVAVALSLAGDVEQGRKVVEELEERYAEDTLVKLSFGPTVRALLALKEGNPASAIEVLRPTAVYELGWTGNGSVGFNGTLYPIYVRGLAYLARHQGAEAAAEFQKILDHRGIVINSQIGALARLQKGRALAMSGDRDKARATYQDFLTLWKAADTNIPVLVAAKAEYSKL